MNSKIIAIILIVLGIVMMVYTGFNYVTTKNIVHMGPMMINQQQNHFVQWSPVIGIVLLVGGIIVLLTQKKA